MRARFVIDLQRMDYAIGNDVCQEGSGTCFCDVVINDQLHLLGRPNGTIQHLRERQFDPLIESW